VPVGNHFEPYNVDSGKLKDWFAHQYFRQKRQSFTSEAWTSAKGVFSGIARYEGEERRMHTRCAWVDGTLFYDLNDDDKRVVRVAPDCWEIITDYDVLFYRTATMAAQVVPSIEDDNGLSLLDWHYRFKNEDDHILHVICMMTMFLPHTSHPLDCVHGSHGSSKTTTLRKDKSIVDPDRCDILSMPKSREDLAIMLDKHYHLCLDNLSSISAEMSDLLCMAATGGTVRKRKLYTNDDEVVLEFKQPVSMCGINVVARRPDLLDRSILLELDRLSPTELKTEAKLWAAWEADKPAILGTIFSILSRAMQIFPTLELEILGRMADFTTWGYAIAEAAGIGGQRFLEAYINNRNRANDEAINSHPVASAVLKLMGGGLDWSGNATDLLRELTIIAEQNQINLKSYLWPKDPAALSRRLNEVKPNLAQLGLVIENQKGGTRLITITKTSLQPRKVLQDAQILPDDADEGETCTEGAILDGEQSATEAVDPSAFDDEYDNDGLCADPPDWWLANRSRDADSSDFEDFDDDGEEIELADFDDEDDLPFEL
jgi:hypothetical protein